MESSHASLAEEQLYRNLTEVLRKNGILPFITIRPPDRARTDAAKAVLWSVAEENRMLWRDDIIGVVGAWMRSDEAGDPIATGWLSVLSQLARAIDNPENLPPEIRPHCGRCDTPFTWENLPEVIMLTCPVEDIATFHNPRIGGMCLACAVPPGIFDTQNEDPIPSVGRVPSEIKPVADPSAYRVPLGNPGLHQELAWFATVDDRILGVLVRDVIDQDFGWVALAQDHVIDRYRAIDLVTSWSSSAEAALEELQCAMRKWSKCSQVEIDEALK